MSLLRRLSPVTTILIGAGVLVLASTGGAVASIVVTSAQIKDETIQSRDVHNGSLQGLDVKDSSLTGTDVKTGSLTGSDIKDKSLGVGELSITAQRNLRAQGVTGLHITPANRAPSPLTNTHSGSASLQTTFTTTVAGKLLLSQWFGAQITCSATGSPAWWFLMLDDVPVPGTATYFPNSDTFITRTVTGVTSGAIAAGTHTLKVGAQCVGTWGGNGEAARGTATVVVLGS